MGYRYLIYAGLNATSEGSCIKSPCINSSGVISRERPRRQGNFLYDLIIFLLYRVIYISLFLTGECQYLIKSKLILKYRTAVAYIFNFRSRASSLHLRFIPKQFIQHSLLLIRTRILRELFILRRLFYIGKKWAGQTLRRLEKSARGFTIRAGVRLMRGGRPDSMNGEIARGFSTEGLFMFFQNVEVIPKWKKLEKKKFHWIAVIIKIFGACIYLYNGLPPRAESDCHSGDRDVGTRGHPYPRQPSIPTPRNVTLNYNMEKETLQFWWLFWIIS